MSTARITISLERSERAALMQLADSELRDPRAQARYILRSELERRGLLPAVEQKQKSFNTPEVNYATS